MLGITPGVLVFISWVVDLEVLKSLVPGSGVLDPGSCVLRSWDPGSWGPRSQPLGSWFLILDYALITLQINLFKEVTGNRVSNIVQETSV